MGAIVAEQPNGLLCRLDTMSGDITAYDMTEDGYIEHVAYIYAEMGRLEARKTLKKGLYPFQKVLDNIVCLDKEKEEINEILKEMGCIDKQLK